MLKEEVIYIGLMSAKVKEISFKDGGYQIIFSNISMKGNVGLRNSSEAYFDSSGYEELNTKLAIGEKVVFKADLISEKVSADEDSEVKYSLKHITDVKRVLTPKQMYKYEPLLNLVMKEGQSVVLLMLNGRILGHSIKGKTKWTKRRGKRRKTDNFVRIGKLGKLFTKNRDSLRVFDNYEQAKEASDKLNSILGNNAKRAYAGEMMKLFDSQIRICINL